MSINPTLRREVLVNERNYYRFGGVRGEAQSIGVGMGINFLLEGKVIREVVGPDSKVTAVEPLSTDTEMIDFLPKTVTSVHPSVTAVEGILSFTRPSYDRPEIIDTMVTMMISRDPETGAETSRIELPTANG